MNLTQICIVCMLSLDQCYACVDIVHMLPAHCKRCDIIFYKLGSNLWEKMSLLTFISGTWQIYCILVVVIELLISQT